VRVRSIRRSRNGLTLVVWNLYGDFPGYFPRYNIAPSQDVPVILRNQGRNELKPMRWGLVPSWAQDPSMGQGMINARAETLLEKPSFKQLVPTRRCLVPADGFYEWRREGNRKVPDLSQEPQAVCLSWGCGIVESTAIRAASFTLSQSSRRERLG
jgi:putative SOS response-associated peptidase YedK